MATKKPKPIDEQALAQRKLTKQQLVALQFIAHDVVTYKFVHAPVWRARVAGVERVQLLLGPFDVDITQRVNRMRKRGLVERKTVVVDGEMGRWPRYTISPLGKAVLAKEQANLT